MLCLGIIKFHNVSSHESYTYSHDTFFYSLPHFLSQPLSLILPLASSELRDWLTEVVTCHRDTLYEGTVSVASGGRRLVLYHLNITLQNKTKVKLTIGI